MSPSTGPMALYRTLYGIIVAALTANQSKLPSPDVFLSASITVNTLTPSSVTSILWHWQHFLPFTVFTLLLSEERTRSFDDPDAENRSFGQWVKMWCHYSLDKMFPLRRESPALSCLWWSLVLGALMNFLAKLYCQRRANKQTRHPLSSVFNPDKQDFEFVDVDVVYFEEYWTLNLHL